MKKMLLAVSWPVWMLFLLSSLLFVFFPQIDIVTTSWFYDEELRFYLKKSWWVMVLYDSVKYVIILSVLGALALWLYNRFGGHNAGSFTGKKLAYLLLVLALGPGLIVNWVFKENWGRARPHQTTVFGGDQQFTPAFVITDQCATNCSFSCGHASGAYFVIALALLARSRRPMWLTLAIVYGSAVGLARMVAGGHFFSDVVVSFFIVYIVARMLYQALFESESEVKSAA